MPWPHWRSVKKGKLHTSLLVPVNASCIIYWTLLNTKWLISVKRVQNHSVFIHIPGFIVGLFGYFEHSCITFLLKLCLNALVVGQHRWYIALKACAVRSYRKCVKIVSEFIFRMNWNSEYKIPVVRITKKPLEVDTKFQISSGLFAKQVTGRNALHIHLAM